jgi:hypothetical protein
MWSWKSWKPRLLSLEESMWWIVLSGFLVVIPACLHGVHLRSWKEYADLGIWVAMFGYGVWSAVAVSRKNRQERARGDAESPFRENG